MSVTCHMKGPVILLSEGGFPPGVEIKLISSIRYICDVYNEGMQRCSEDEVQAATSTTGSIVLLEGR